MMVERRNIILKLGGSTIAVKNDSIAEKDFYRILSGTSSESKDPTTIINECSGYIKWNELERLAEGIKKTRNQVDDLIIVHGAGIFGHALVSYYLHQERATREFIGWPKTILTVSIQNLYIVNFLQHIGIPAISIPPHVAFEGFGASFDGVVTRNATLKTEVIENMLYRGYVPVLYGDMIIDKAGQFRVLSGDTILPILVRELGGIDEVIGISSFPPEVDREIAVYTRDPLDLDAKIIRKIFVSPIGIPTVQLENGQILPLKEMLHSSSDLGTDVTGKMFGKVKDFIECARFGVKGRIIGPNHLLKAIDQEEVGTEIIPEQT